MFLIIDFNRFLYQNIETTSSENDYVILFDNFQFMKRLGAPFDIDCFFDILIHFCNTYIEQKLRAGITTII